MLNRILTYMLVKTEDKSIIVSTNQFNHTKSRIKLFITLKCDTCELVFETTNKNKLKTKFHFCSRKCQGKARKHNGILHFVYQKSQETCVQRYGYKNALKNETIKRKLRATCLQRHGVESPLQSPLIREKRRQTMISRYGVSEAMQSAEIKAKFDWQGAQRKRHETMKRENLYGKSRSESKFYKFLTDRFQIVECQKLVNDGKWPIDFYIPTHNLYIQFDGDYWHGLDRQLDVILQSSSPRDAVIYRKWLTDRKQESWFYEHGLALLRIRESDFKTPNWISIFDSFMNQYISSVVS